MKNIQDSLFEAIKFIGDARKFCPKCLSHRTEGKIHWDNDDINSPISIKYTCLNCKENDEHSKFLDLESIRNKKINQILK